MDKISKKICGFESAYNQIPGFILWEKNHECIYFNGNNNCAKLFGVKWIEDINGLTDYDIILRWVELAKVFQEHDKQVFLAKKPIKFLEILDCNNGEWRISLVTKIPLFNEENIVIGTRGYSVDITNPFIKLGYSLSMGQVKYIRSVRAQNSYIVGQTYKNIDLTLRQSECLFFLLRGKSAKEIAKVLKLSPRTIEDHIEKLKTKFNCQSRFELVDKAIENGFLNVIPRSIFNTQMAICLND